MSLKVVHPTDDAQIIYGAGDEYRFLITGEGSGGKYFIFHAVVPPGGGPPLHTQSREEEAFYVLEGELTFRPEGKSVVCGEGSFLHIPRGVPHSFKNESNVPARMLIIFSPAGIEGMFEAMGADPENYVSIANEYGVEFPEDE